MYTSTARGATRNVFLVVLLLVTISVAVVFGLLFRRTAQYENLVLSYEAERTAGALIESYLRGNLSESTAPEELPQSIASFGVYAADGRALLRIGEAPPRLRAEAVFGGDSGTAATLQGPRFYRLGRDRVRLVRPLRMPFGPPRDTGRRGPSPGMSPGRGMMPGTGTSSRGMAPAASQELALIDLDASSLLAGQRARRQGLLAVLAVTIILAALVVRAYLRLRQSELEAQRNARLAQLGGAARTLTHEIRNPLAAIRLQTAILAKQLGEEHADTLTALNEEVGRIGSLVEDVRTFLGSSRGTPQRVDLAQAAADLIERLGYPASFVSDGETHPVCIDPGRLRSILGNVMDNAVEASAESGSREPVEVRVESHRGHELLFVVDSGPGIPPGSREKVFDPFFTTKEGGSGIGLAIVRRFVEEAAGRVGLESRSGGGTIVRIEFPRGKDCATSDS